MNITDNIEDTGIVVNDPSKNDLYAQACYRYQGFDSLPAFAGFLPGIGGEQGIPLWCMYVNRGQGIVSFGCNGKDGAIAELMPATWAWQMVGTQGFRTFCKIDGQYYEPFQRNESSMKYEVSRSMQTGLDYLQIEEINQTLGLAFKVKYFTLVNQPVVGLVRQLTIENLNTEIRNIEILDGLPQILPSGFSDISIKKTRRIMEAYANVNCMPDGLLFYQTKVACHDEAEVLPIDEGNFYAALREENNEAKILKPIVDPDIVFGANSDLITPRLFIENEFLSFDNQLWENRIPCALIPDSAVIESGGTYALTSVVGNAEDISICQRFIKQNFTWKNLSDNFSQSNELIKTICSPALTVSNSSALNGYALQNFLDNVLRGGIPHLLPTSQGTKPIYLYSRRHGDLERDYNEFNISANPLSDGAGNYRDMLQNRRNYSWFYPEDGDHGIRMFANLIQADGYNPLGVTGYRWKFIEEENIKQYCPIKSDRALRELSHVLSGTFAPGELLSWQNRWASDIENKEEWFENILRNCKTVLEAEGHDGGYWVDHWTYLADMLDAYQAIYPDKVFEMLTAEADIGWFHDGSSIAPRSEKFKERVSGVLQLDSCVDVPKPEIPLPPVTLLAKLTAMLTVKIMSLDIEGCGIEMEAGRPGWNDSLNGLPAIFGSSVNETCEIARLAGWILDSMQVIPVTVFPKEVFDFLQASHSELEAGDYNWDRSAALREAYYEKLTKNASGTTGSIAGEKLVQLLTLIKERAIAGVEKATDAKTKLIHTYYMGKDVSYDVAKNSANESPEVSIKSMTRIPLPLFLEGQVRQLHLNKSKTEVQKIHASVLSSTLYDKPLKMLKLNEWLKDCPSEIGRARTFSRGWFENESIWTHMSYKYLLQILKHDLVEEFLEAAQTMLIPFMDPKVYGRSILENSSFISSSDNPDPNVRGRGFVARLTGATAEFIQMFLILTSGSNPFRMSDSGALQFTLQPRLPGEWFTKEGTAFEWKGNTITIPQNSFACVFLGSILIVYKNESRGNCFGSEAVQPISIQLDGNVTIDSNLVEGPLAESIREREVERIDVTLG